MAEYIEREAILQEMTSKPLPKDAQHLYLTLRNIVKKAPAADVIEVVRCKTCELRNTKGCPVSYYDSGYNLICEVEDNDFCSFGKRKDGCNNDF